MQTEPTEKADADERADRDADCARGHVDRHAGAAASLGEQRAHIERPERVEGSGTET